MTRPKYYYPIVEREFVAHSEDGKCLSLQQACPLGRDHRPDSIIYLSPENAVKLRDAITTWLIDAPPS